MQRHYPYATMGSIQGAKITGGIRLIPLASWSEIPTIQSALHKITDISSPQDEEEIAKVPLGGIMISFLKSPVNEEKEEEKEEELRKAFPNEVLVLVEAPYMLVDWDEHDRQVEEAGRLLEQARGLQEVHEDHPRAKELFTQAAELLREGCGNSPEMYFLDLVYASQEVFSSVLGETAKDEFHKEFIAPLLGGIDHQALKELSSKATDTAKNLLEHLDSTKP